MNVAHRSPSPTRAVAVLLGALVALLLAAAASASAATVTVTGGGNVPEGGQAQFTVTKSWIMGIETAPDANVSVADGTATSPADYGAAAPNGGGACAFVPLTTCTVDIPYVVDTVDDNIDEPNETFSAKVTSADLSGSGDVNFTIVDNDPTPKASVNDQTVSEGAGNATFTVSLSNPSEQPGGIDVPWATAPQSATGGNAPTPGVDYISSNGTVHFNAGETTKTFAVPIVDDNVTEPQEKFLVNLSPPPANATLADAQGVGTINDNDPPPVIKLDGAEVTEGNNGTRTADFDVELSHPSAFPIDVDYRTNAKSATAGDDYVSKSGTVHFDPGETEHEIHVLVNGDTTDEPDENFEVQLSSPVNATIGDNDKNATIKDDDAAPTVSIGNEAVREGDSGTVQATFDVVLSAASGYTVTVNYATADGTARAGSDYVAEQGTLTFAPGQTRKQVTVVVDGDTAFEADETFTVRLSNPVHTTIVDAGGQSKILNDDRDPAASSDHGSSSQPSGNHTTNGGSSDSGQGGTTPSRRQRGPRVRISLSDDAIASTLHLVVACPPSEAVCRGALTLSTPRTKHKRARRLGSAHFAIKGGDSRTVSVHLSRDARRLLARRAGHLTATVTARDEDGNVGVTKRAFDL